MESDWHDFIRPLRKTTADENIDKLFSKMKPHKETLAAVMIKKRFSSIVTMEDIMEEIILP